MNNFLELDRLIANGGIGIPGADRVPKLPRNTDMMTIDDAKKKQMEIKLL